MYTMYTSEGRMQKSCNDVEEHSVMLTCSDAIIGQPGNYVHSHSSLHDIANHRRQESNESCCSWYSNVLSM